MSKNDNRDFYGRELISILQADQLWRDPLAKTQPSALNYPKKF